MNTAELRAVGLARFGPNWQSPLARAIGMSPRHMHRLASGQVPVSDLIAHDIRIVLGIAHNIESLAWPRDEWIMGDAGNASGREYLVHAQPPRFIARVIELDNDGLCDEDADLLTGVIFTGPDQTTTLCEIVWIDPTPPENDLKTLLAGGLRFLDQS